MIEHLALDHSQIEPSEIAASINRTISYSVCYENHDIPSTKPFHLNTVADFLVGIKVMSDVYADFPIIVHLIASDIELCQWNITESQRIYPLGSSLRITETESHIHISGLLPLLACGSSIRLCSSAPIVIQCVYMTSYSLYVRHLFRRRPIHMVIEKENEHNIYRIERESIVLMKSPPLPLE
jgi:hypothetical protein